MDMLLRFPLRHMLTSIGLSLPIGVSREENFEVDEEGSDLRTQ